MKTRKKNPLFTYAFFLLLPCFYSLSVIAQPAGKSYDSTLARTLGADDYGMKTYVFVILKTGPTIIADKAIEDSLFAGHMRNISRLAGISAASY